MKAQKLILSATLVFTCFVAASAQPDAKDGNSIGAVDLPYDCAAVNAIRFNPKAYSELSYHEQKWVDTKWHKCQPKEKEPDEQEVIIVNPVATGDDDKIFYGTISRRQLMDAREKCVTAGKYGGVAISVAGAVTGNAAAAEVGTVVFNYSDVSCSSLSGEIEKGNLLAILGPSQIVEMAVANRLTKDFINNIPIVSGADKDKLKDLAKEFLIPPSVNVTGSNVKVSVGGASVSLQTPRVVIGGTRLSPIKLPKPLRVKFPRCHKVFGKKICR